MIGYGQVGRSKIGQKNRISFLDGPLLFITFISPRRHVSLKIGWRTRGVITYMKLQNESTSFSTKDECWVLKRLKEFWRQKRILIQMKNRSFKCKIYPYISFVFKGSKSTNFHFSISYAQKDSAFIGMGAWHKQSHLNGCLKVGTLLTTTLQNKF